MRWSTVLTILLVVVVNVGFGVIALSTAVEPTTDVTTVEPRTAEDNAVESTSSEDGAVESITLRNKVKSRMGMRGSNLKAAENTDSDKPAESAEADEADDAAAAEPGQPSQPGKEEAKPAEPAKDSAQQNEPGKEVDKPAEPAKDVAESKQPDVKPAAAPTGQGNESAAGGLAPGGPTSGRPVPGGSASPAQAGDCPLQQVGDHPWLIRITPMMKLPNPPIHQTGIGRGEGRVPDPEEDIDFVPEPLSHKRFRRVAKKQQADSDSYQDDIKAYDPDDDEPAEMTPKMANRNKKDLVADGSKMHGSLITSVTVLTTASYQNAWASNLPFPEKYLSLIGYNPEQHCYQEQWGKDVVFHAHSGEFALNAGEFALITTAEPFNVVGDPFLFGSPMEPPDFQTIASMYELMTEDASTELTIYAYKQKSNIADNNIFEPNTFKFISWTECKDIDVVQKITGISPRVQPGTFFCVTGVQGWPTPEDDKVDDDLLGVDWFQGAPAIYKDKQSRMIPLGQYIYRVGQTGDPHIFATFTEKFGQLLVPEGVVGLETPEDTEDIDVSIATSKPPRPEHGEDARQMPHDANNKTVAGGPHSHTAVLWVVNLGVSATVGVFLGSYNKL